MSQLNKEAFSKGFADVCVKHKVNPADLVKQAGVMDLLKGGLNLAGRAGKGTWDGIANHWQKAVAPATLLGLLGAAKGTEEVVAPSGPIGLVKDFWPEMTATAVGIPASIMAYKALAKKQHEDELNQTQSPALKTAGWMDNAYHWTADKVKHPVDSITDVVTSDYFPTMWPYNLGAMLTHKAAPDLTGTRRAMAIAGTALPVLAGMGAWQLGDYYKNKNQAAPGGNEVDQILGMSPEGQFNFMSHEKPKPQGHPDLDPTAKL